MKLFVMDKLSSKFKFSNKVLISLALKLSFVIISCKLTIGVIVSSKRLISSVESPISLKNSTSFASIFLVY